MAFDLQQHWLPTLASIGMFVFAFADGYKQFDKLPTWVSYLAWTAFVLAWFIGAVWLFILVLGFVTSVSPTLTVGLIVLIAVAARIASRK